MNINKLTNWELFKVAPHIFAERMVKTRRISAKELLDACLTTMTSEMIEEMLEDLELAPE
jgi:hypothetical protein